MPKKKAWELFMTDKMLNNIVKFTNIRIYKIKLNLDDTKLVKINISKTMQLLKKL